MSAEPLLELAEHVLTHAGATDDPAQALVLADAAAEAANAQLLAAALDRAWGLAPTHPGLAPWRAQTLDGLELKEHGLIFRFVPPGTFLMGSVQGDLDEQPVHPVRTDGFWLTDVPVSWADYCRLLGWGPPPRAEPPVPRTREDFPLHFDPRICMQYCETETLRAVDWHAHAGMEHSGPVPRRHPESPDNYAQKPMVSVSWRGA